MATVLVAYGSSEGQTAASTDPGTLEFAGLFEPNESEETC